MLCAASSVLGTDVPQLFSCTHHLFNPGITLNLPLFLISQPDEDLFNPDYVEVDRILEVAHTKDPDTGEVSGYITRPTEGGKLSRRSGPSTSITCHLRPTRGLPSLAQLEPYSWGAPGTGGIQRPLNIAVI